MLLKGIDDAAKLLFKFYGVEYFKDEAEAAHFIRYNVQKRRMSPSWVEALANVENRGHTFHLGAMPESFYNEWRKVKNAWDR